MSEISSAYSSSSRITGVFSGLDTDQIVKDLLKVEQTKIDGEKQTAEKYGWYTDAVKTVSEEVEAFQKNYLSAMGSSGLMLPSTYKQFSVTYKSGNSGAVTVSAGMSAAVGSVKINSITQLAENANVSSSSRISANGKEISANNTTKLRDLKFATPLVFDERGKISFRINGVDFSFSSDTTLQSMINTINADSRANVTMKYSRLTDGFTITADKGGAESSVTIENLSGNAFGANGAFGIGTGTVSNGKNAVLSIEGVLLEQDSNTFSIDGITYTLNGTSQEAIEFRVEQDVSKTVESIKSFVDAYNELVENIKGKLTEKDYSKEYAPLTEAQKEEMSDDQIEAWEKKAKSGILRKNGDIKRLLSSLQNAFFTAVGGSGSTMASIGITTGGFFTSDKGKIVVDTDMLTKALQENPDRVSNMFTETSEESGKTGLLHLMRDAAQTFSKNAKEDILAVTKKENDLNNRIEDMEDQLDDLADRYYRKFSVMETALSKLNSVAGMLASMFNM